MSAGENSHRGQAPKDHTSPQSWQHPSLHCHQEDQTESSILCKPDHLEGARWSCQRVKR